MAEHLEFPCSGRFLGFFVDLLRLRQQPGSALSSGTDRRQDDEYLRGGPVTSDRAASLQRRARVRSQIAETLVESRLVPDWPTPTGRRSARELLAEAIDDVAHLIDEVYGSMTANRGIEVPVRLAARPLLRLLAIDLGVRLGAVHYLCGWQFPQPAVPAWSREDGGGDLLRRLCPELRDGGHAGVLAELSYILFPNDGSDRNVHKATLAEWIEGRRRPDHDHVAALAAYVEARGRVAPATGPTLRQQLEWHWAMWDGARRLRECIPGSHVEEFGFWLLGFAWETRHALSRLRPDRVDSQVFAETVLTRGTRGSTRVVLGRALQLRVTDDFTVDFIRVAFQDWRRFLALMLSCYERFDLEGTDTKIHPALDPVLQLEACFLGPPENAADEIPLLDKRGAALYAVEHALTHGANVLAKRAAENALSRWPDDPLVLCEVGICFADLGLRERARECLSKSHEMVLGYGVAGLALGRLLLDAGDADGAARVLENMNERLGSHARADACELLGVAHLRRRDPERADAALERAIEILPESPLAWALRSRIAEHRGRVRDATTYRSIAERLGLRVRPS